MNAILLARVSTEDQREAGNSLPAQISRMESYCARMGFHVIDQHSFDESAYKKRRDQFDKILKNLKTGKEIVAVCFDKVDRFSRNVFDTRVATLYELATTGKIELHFVSEGLVINGDISASEKFQFSVTLGLAKYYSDAISDNVKRAFEQKRRNGEWTGRAPLGYVNIKDAAGNSDIVFDPEKSHLVRLIFEAYSKGDQSISSVLELSYDAGLRGFSKNRLAKSMVEHILKNPFYYGVARAKGELYPHKYAPLITKELFDQCQSVLKGHNKKPVKYAAKPFVLRGMVRCDKCGCSLSPEIKQGKYIYYACTNARKAICNKKVFVREEALLKPIQAVLEAFSAIPQSTIDELVKELKKSHANKTVYHNAQLKRIQNEYDVMQVKIDRLVDLLVDESITKPDYDKKLREYKDKQYDLEIQLGEYTRADENYAITANTVLNLAKNAQHLFENSEVEEKRQILGFLLQNCRLVGKELLFDLQKPFDSIAKSAQEAVLAKQKGLSVLPDSPLWLRD